MKKPDRRKAGPWTVFVADIEGHSSPHIEHGELEELLHSTADMIASQPDMFGRNDHGQPAFRIEAHLNPFGTKWATPTEEE